MRQGNGIIIGNQTPAHNHSSNVAIAFARKAVGEMKKKMAETVATPSSSCGVVMANLDPHVLIALPKKSSLHRILRRHRQVALSSSDSLQTLSPPPTDFSFDFP